MFSELNIEKNEKKTNQKGFFQYTSQEITKVINLQKCLVVQEYCQGKKCKFFFCARNGKRFFLLLS